MYLWSKYSRAGQAGGGNFKREQIISQRKTLPIECVRDKNQRDAQTISLPFHGGDVTCLDVMYYKFINRWDDRI